MRVERGCQRPPRDASGARAPLSLRLVEHHRGGDGDVEGLHVRVMSIRTDSSPAETGVLSARSIDTARAANIGIGALGPTTWGISTATSGAIRQLLDTDIPALPSGLWAYRVDQRRTLVGSAMSDCGRVLDWCRNELAMPFDIDATDTATLFSGPPSQGTPLVVPFFSGERGTKWRGSSRAMFTNVGASTTWKDMLLGAMEGVAVSFLRIADQLREAGVKPTRREGAREGRWALLDYVDIVVHIQHADERSFYALERLWQDCPVVEIEGVGDTTDTVDGGDSA